MKLIKRTVSNLNAHVANGGAAASTFIPITYSIFFVCKDIIHTSKDYDGRHCDIATENDSCLSVCDNKCNDF
ncbi:MAG: hypothetical protein AAF611_16855 [Bacteroidota bacterium]